MKLTKTQKRVAWIGGLGLAGLGLAFALEKTAKAATSSGAPVPTPAPTQSGPTVTLISQLSATGPNGCTWRTPASAPNDVYQLAGSISNNRGPIPWQEGMSYGPLTMSDGNTWRLNMATGITNPQKPIHDVQAQVCS
jgi:hypothetical protein